MIFKGSMNPGTGTLRPRDPTITVNLLKTQPKLLPKNLTFRPLSEAFIRRSWYSVLPVLYTTGRRRVKKAVVCVALVEVETSSFR